MIFFKPVIKKALGENERITGTSLYLYTSLKVGISPFFKPCKRIHIVFFFLVLGQGTKIGLQVSQTSLQISSEKETMSAREDP